MNLRNRQLQLIVRKLLLGDDREQILSEERGRPTANELAKRAAEDLGFCSCSRSDGIICGRDPSPGHLLCWACWANQKDKKPCTHRKGAESG